MNHLETSEFNFQRYVEEMTSFSSDIEKGFFDHAKEVTRDYLRTKAEREETERRDVFFSEVVEEYRSKVQIWTQEQIENVRENPDAFNSVFTALTTHVMEFQSFLGYYAEVAGIYPRSIRAINDLLNERAVLYKNLSQATPPSPLPDELNLSEEQVREIFRKERKKKWILALASILIAGLVTFLILYFTIK